MNKGKIILLWLFSVALLQVVRGQPTVKIEQRAVEGKNSNKHIFPLPINKLKDSLQAFFIDFDKQHNNPYLKRVFSHKHEDGHISQMIFFVATSDRPSGYSLKGYNYFKKPGRENDVYLDTDITAWDSPVYHEKGNPLPYISSFSLKLASIDSFHTKLTVEAEDPRVFISPYYWTQCWSCGIFALDLRVKNVLPTTIEEHSLLLYIANKLGDETIEPLKMPMPQ